MSELKVCFTGLATSPRSQVGTVIAKSRGRERYTQTYMWLVVAVGALVCMVSAYNVSELRHLDARFFLISAVTLIFGSRIGVEIPRVGGRVTVSDPLVFITMILFGREAATLLSAADGACSSIRISRKPRTILFNAAVMACASFLTTSILGLFTTQAEMLRQDHTHLFIITLCLMGLLQYVANSGLVALAAAFKTDQPIWQTWRRYYLWTSISYFAGASAAGIISKLIEVLGFYVVFATLPVIVVVYFTYQTYLRNVAASVAQAAQAENHVKELSYHVAKLERVTAEREQISRALQHSEEQFRSAFNSAAIGMALVSNDARWLRVNPALCRILGYPEDELAKTSEAAVTHPDDREASQAHLNRIIKGEIFTSQWEKRYIHQLGHEVWSDISVALAHDSETGTPHLILQIQDITQRKYAENRIRASLKEKEVLLKEIHHRVKNNLQVITSLLNLQSKHINDKHALSIFKESQNRVKSMALIHETLYQSSDLSRINLTDYMGKLAAFVSRSYRINPEAVKLTFNIENLSLSIDSAVPCGLIMNELISNALKHAFPTGGPGEVVIGFRRIDWNYEMSVRDNGIGLCKPVDLENTTSLGMKLVRTLTDQLNGEIEISSEGGTTFRITFPLDDPQKRGAGKPA